MYTDDQYILKPDEFDIRNQLMPRKMARKYFDWYISIIPTRMSILAKRVKSLDILLDFSRKSLEKLDEFYFSNLSYGQLVRQDGTRFISAETITMCFDLGIYWGECFVRNFEAIHWELNTGMKQEVDYHRPVIGGFQYGESFCMETILFDGSLYYLGDERAERKKQLTFQYDLWIKKIPEPGREYILKGIDRDRQQKLPDSVLEEFGIKDIKKKK